MIDMEKSFSHNLCELVYKAMHTFLNNQSVNFTPAEINGLIIYRNTLKKLIEKHPPHILHEKLYEFASQTRIKAKKLQKLKRIISESYISAQQLIILLDELITRYKTGKRGYNHNYEQCNFVSMQQESCTCCIEQHMMHNTDLLCSEEQFNYIADRLHAYSHAFAVCPYS